MRQTKPGGTVAGGLWLTVTPLVLLPPLVTPIPTLRLPVTDLSPGDTPPLTAPPAFPLPAFHQAAPGGWRGGVRLVTVLCLLSTLETFASSRTLEVFLPELAEAPGLWVEVTALAGLLAFVPVIITLGEIVTNPNTVKTILGLLIAFTFPLARSGCWERIQEQK